MRRKRTSQKFAFALIPSVQVVPDFTFFGLDYSWPNELCDWGYGDSLSLGRGGISCDL